MSGSIMNSSVNTSRRNLVNRIVEESTHLDGILDGFGSSLRFLALSFQLIRLVLCRFRFDVHILQDLVAAYMPAIIVDQLEIVDVEQHEVELVLVFTALFQVLFELEVEIAPIPGAG